MHHALRVEEILLNIFGHCLALCRDDIDSTNTSDLAALARTCRTFKEPALDVLWSELRDLSPLSRCLPDVSCLVNLGHIKLYGFHRPLSQRHWAVLKSYTRRILWIYDFGRLLYWESVNVYFRQNIVEPLFPNLRFIHDCDFSEKVTPWLFRPLPSLTRLCIDLEAPWNLNTFENRLKTLVELSPNIIALFLHGFQTDFFLSEIVAGHIRCWPKLQELFWSGYPADVDVLPQLSILPIRRLELTTFDIDFQDEDVCFDSVHTFSNLDRLELFSGSLAPIPRFLSRMRLPALKVFKTRIEMTPSKEYLPSFLTSIQTCGMDRTIEEWRLIHEFDYYVDNDSPFDSEPYQLDMDDLRACMSFGNLRVLEIDIWWDVALGDDELLTLGRAWPKLEQIHINQDWGWKGKRGITPVGFARLLQTCPSLVSIALAIDTLGFVELPPALAQASPRLKRPPDGTAYRIDVLDSVIEEESVPAMVAFFVAIVPPGHFKLDCIAWDCEAVAEHIEKETYVRRWRNVFVQTCEVVKCPREKTSRDDK